MKDSRQLLGPSVLLLAFVGLLLIRYEGDFGFGPNDKGPIESALILEVAGDVDHPGIYRFDGPISVERLIEEAGARAGEIEDKGKYPVPTTGSRWVFQRESTGCLDIVMGRMSAAALMAHRLPIDINKARAEAFELLPGIGPVLAGRIVARREKRGGFEKEEDLLQVRGIGPRTLERIRSRIAIAAPDP